MRQDSHAFFLGWRNNFSSANSLIRNLFVVTRGPGRIPRPRIDYLAVAGETRLTRGRFLSSVYIPPVSCSPDIMVRHVPASAHFFTDNVRETHNRFLAEPRKTNRLAEILVDSLDFGAFARYDCLADAAAFSLGHATEPYGLPWFFVSVAYPNQGACRRQGEKNSLG